ncbi:unnamed protein product [Linum tenue]|uniref:Probable purine permease n=1 Tax=Linum tenue TaxID=586396 RepID=A0AAV0IH82_9ROSI|nr:unnamed protein product [Linum tenue]
MKLFLVLLNCFLLTVGQVGGPLLARTYFLHGGKRRWLSAWILTCGFPIMLLPLAVSYYSLAAKSKTTQSTGRFTLTRWLFATSAVLGTLLGLDSYLYSFGTSYLPVSVSSLLGSTQLAFTAVFAFLIVKQKFTPYTVNAVVLMTFGSAVLGFHMDGGVVPRGESVERYALGFFMTVAAAALHGFLMTALEYVHRKAGVPLTFDLVMQVQFVISMFAAVFCTVPMIINRDFQAMAKEAVEFDLGETKYYMTILLAAVALQLMIIGSIGLVFSSSSLFSGLVTSFLVPTQQVFAVIFLREGFDAEKGMALAMCLWGFASHLYGEHKAAATSDNKQPTPRNHGDQEDSPADV